MRSRVPAHITEMTDRGFGLTVEVNRSERPKQDSNATNGVTQDGKIAPFFTGYREVIPPGKIGSKEAHDLMEPAPQRMDTVAHYETEQNDPTLHGPMEAMRSADRSVPFQDYASFQPRTAPIPRAAQDDLYLEGPGRNAADPRMQDRDSSELFPGRRETVDNCDLYGDNVAGVLHNNNGVPETPPKKPVKVQTRKANR